MKPKEIDALALLNAYHEGTNLNDAPAVRLAAAAGTCFTGRDNPADVARIVATVAEDRGIPADAPELEAYRDGFRQVRRQVEEAEARDKALQAAGKARESLDQLDKTKDGADAAALRDALREVQATIAPALAADKKGITADTLDDFGSCEGLPIHFWNDLPIPSPGITLIGAETGRGKTTALVNMARELLEAGRRVLFLSYEMSGQEIGLALRLSIAAADNATPLASYHPRMEYQGDGSGEDFKEPSTKDIHPTGDALNGSLFERTRAYLAAGNTLPDFLKTATGDVKAWLEKDQLRIVDAPGHAGEMYAEISGTDFDAYILDYMQAVPAAPEAARDGYRRVAETVEKIREAANAHGKTIITAGQFRRKDKKQIKEKEFDPEAEQFREAADLEQMAHLAIGLGYYEENGEERYFWKILKHRFDGGLRDYRMFSTGKFPYHYLQRGGPWVEPKAWKDYIKKDTPLPAEIKQKNGKPGMTGKQRPEDRLV